MTSSMPSNSVPTRGSRILLQSSAVDRKARSSPHNDVRGSVGCKSQSSYPTNSPIRFGRPQEMLRASSSRLLPSTATAPASSAAGRFGSYWDWKRVLSCMGYSSDLAYSGNTPPRSLSETSRLAVRRAASISGLSGEPFYTLDQVAQLYISMLQSKYYLTNTAVCQASKSPADVLTGAFNWVKRLKAKMVLIPTNRFSGGYSSSVGRSREGYPIYLYTDPHTKRASYVVVLPNGRAFYSDSEGQIITTSSNQGNAETASALVFGGWRLADRGSNRRDSWSHRRCDCGEPV
jgi:hypothetical protein